MPIEIADIPLAHTLLDDESPLAAAIRRIQQQAEQPEEETVCGFSNFV